MKSDCLLDYMLLDESGKIIAMDFCGSEKYSRDIEPSFSLRFYRSLHKDFVRKNLIRKLPRSTSIIS